MTNWEILEKYLFEIDKDKYRLMTEFEHPMLIVKGTLTKSIVDEIHKIVNIYSIGGTYKNSTYYRKGYTTIVFFQI